MDKLTGQGYSAHLVGGCVRDSLLGRSPSDWDVATSALPHQVQEVFAGSKVLLTGERHGTVTLVEGGMPIEITTLRRDGEYLDHRRPVEVSFTRSLEEDLARRDFTVNAMAYHPLEGLCDPFGGQDDLERRRLRCVGEPRCRFEEDALRMMRLFRFSSQLSFELEEETLLAAGEKAPLLKAVSAERIAAELERLLLGKGVFSALCLAADSGVLKTILPSIQPGQPSFAAIAAAPPRLPVRMTLLLQKRPDEKKADQPSEEDREAAAEAVAILKGLRYPTKLVQQVEKLVAFRSRKLPAEKAGLRRLCAQLGMEAARDLLEVQKVSDSPEAFPYDHISRLLDEIEANGDPLEVSDLAVGGEELLRLGVPRGPAVGEMLSQLLSMVLDDPNANRREILLDRAKDLWQSRESVTL